MKNPSIGSQVLVKGWVRSVRESKSVSFIDLNDGSTVKKFQAVVAAGVAETELKRLSTGACIAAWGTLVASQGQEQSAELELQGIHVYGEAPAEEYPLQKKGTSLEYLREIAHLRPRTNTFGCIYRLRHGMAYAIHKFFHDKGFYYLHSPIVTGSDAEGAGAMFQVTTLDLDNLPRTAEKAIDYKEDFFGMQTHLTVSGQLEGELAATALGEVYTFGPTFRAENSNTPRHLAEFWMIEPEMAFYEIQDNMDLAEEFLKYLIRFALTECAEDIQWLDKNLGYTIKEVKPGDLMAKLQFVLDNPFVRLSYTEGVDILLKSGQKFEFPVAWGIDLQSEHERYLVEKHFKCPVILTDYPKDIKAFYMKQNEDGRTVRAMDVLFPGIGEIIGGSQREENYDKLMARVNELGMHMDQLWWYLDTRKFGTCPHSGFGLGFERLLLFITGMTNIRDVIPFPRTPKNASF